MRKSKLFVLMLLFGMFSLVHAQERTISGTVTDAETGEGLPGVSVMVQGTSSGTATDFNGEYSVSVDNNTVLVFSFIGYQSQEVTVGTRSTVDVALVTDVQTLSEVIVVGYGTQTRQEVTSSVTSVKAEDFNQGNVNDPAQLLQGKVPGLMVVRPGGNLNNPFKVRLRGLATIGPNSQPLIIIDGVPSNSLGQVDPNDIAAIDVLKDGAAAAIYGTRGSNGVIIVTTKTGRAGTTSVEYNGYFASESIAKLVPMLDAAGYRANVPAATLKDTDIGSSTDWFDELTQNAKSMTHNLSMMGGTNKTTYRISFNYRDQQGVQKLTGFEQLNTRVNLTQKALNDKLTLTGNFAMTRLNSNLGWDEAFRYATIYNPTAPVRVDGSASGLNPADYESSDGYYQLPGAFDYYNPVALIEQNINEETEKQLNFHLKGDYEIMDGLHFNMAYSQQTENQFRNRYYDKQSFWIGADRNGLANKRQRNDFTKIFEAIGLYDKDINDMNLKVLGGYSWQENVWDEFYAEGGNFVADNFTFNNLGAALDFNNGLGNISSWKTRSNLISFFGRANLNINDTYFLMASYRTDGYSGFGENDKWGGFPAVSAGVNLGNLVDIASVDNLKLRLSYGMTGTLPPRTYESIAKVGPVGSAFVNGSFQPAYGPISNDNPDLKWETKKEFNVGLDFSVLDYKLNGSIDFYDKTTSDLLMDFEVPIPPNLARTTLLNIGEMSNSGLEIALNYLLVDNASTTLETGLNFSTFKTVLQSLSNSQLKFGDYRLITDLGAPGQNGTYLIRVEEGEKIGNLFGPFHDENNPVNENGDWNILDTDDNGTIDTDDHGVIGNGLPDYQLGWTTSLKYGNFDANMFWRGVFGHDLLNTFRAFYENPNLKYNMLESSFSPELAGLIGETNIYGSYHVEKGDYVKLDNLSLGYSLNINEDSPFTKARFYVTGMNLITITGYSGVDPEFRPDDDDGGVLAPGIDRRNTWFRTRTYTLGVQLGF